MMDNKLLCCAEEFIIGEKKCLHFFYLYGIKKINYLYK